MKKKLSIVLAAVLCLFVLSGCADRHGGSLNQGVDATPGRANSTFGFDSYGEMIAAFGENDPSESASSIRELKGTLGEPYTRFVEKVAADGAFPQPMLAGEPMAYRNQEGFSNITFHVSELYGLPWIWYYPSVSTGENFYIAVTYLPDETQASRTASEVIGEIAPNAANVNHLGDQHESIYEQPLTLRDREVTALVMDYKNETRDCIYFVYGDLLVLVRCDPNVWTAEWFSALFFDGISR